MLRAKPLEGWITIGEAAEILGVSPQAVHQMCESAKITEANLRRVGKGKPIFLVNEELVNSMAEDREEATQDHEVRQEQKDFSRTRRRAAGRPQLEFMDGS